jgi:hypothetical protein
VGVVEAPVSLTTLAVGIVAEHRAALSASRSALHHAKRAGELLLEAKTQVRHGEWMQWLGANCDLTIRVAQIYMQIARGWPDIETVLNAYPNTHLTITEARALVANTDDEQDENDTDDDPDEDELGTGGCGRGGGNRHWQHNEHERADPNRLSREHRCHGRSNSSAGKRTGSRIRH